MIRITRKWLFIEGSIFLLAAVIHNGYLFAGYLHEQAGVVEMITGSVLLAGLTVSYIFPRLTRTIGLGVQLCALFGTLICGAMIAIGAGPQANLDRAFHVLLIGMILIGFIKMWRGSLRISRASETKISDPKEGYDWESEAESRV